MEENKLKINDKLFSEEEALSEAMRYSKGGDYKNASKFCKLINEFNPRNSEVYFLSGVILYHYGFFDSAIYQINRAIKLSLKAKYYFNRGIVYLDLENNEKAKESFEKCLEIDSNYIKAKELMKEFYG